MKLTDPGTIQVDGTDYAIPWRTLPSDPGVFTALAKKLGLQNVQLAEVYCLDEEEMERVEPPEPNTQDVPDDLWFANQVSDNACATHALLSIAANVEGVQIDEKLRVFLDFSRGLSPMHRGLAVASCRDILATHNSFA
ncbi:Ubiquitin carboxyl-terminal hydrolase bap1, partial [Quaeritorhiza haematococci]